MKRNSLQVKIGMMTGICLVALAVLIIGYAANAMWRRARIARTEAVKNTQQYASEVSKVYANSMKLELEAALDTARVLAQTLSGIKDEVVGVELGRDEVNGILKIILSQNPQFVGVYTAWEPNAFDRIDFGYQNEKGHDDTGRFIPYWTRDQEGNFVVEPLANYEQEGLGDYYLRPKQTHQEVILEPVIRNVQGTPILVTSLVVPVLVKETFYGVVGVDLRLDSFQKAVDKGATMYEGTAQILFISSQGTLVAVSHQPALAGEPLKTMHTQWEDYLESIHKGETVVQEDEETLAIFTPITVGRTATPWAVNVLVPMEKITATADMQRIQANNDIAKMIALSLFLTLAAIGLLWFTARSITRPVRSLVDTASAIANGDLTRAITIRQNDEIGKLAEVFRHMQDQLSCVSQEMKEIIRAVQEGRLDTRGNAEAFSGGWRDLVIGMNHMIDAFMHPLNVTAEYLDRIAKGDIPDQITEEYQGDFNEMKNNLNTLIEAMNATTRIAEAIAIGAVTENVQLRSKHDRLMKALNTMTQRLNAILAETTCLIEAVQAGTLSARGNADAFEGGWQTLITGMNDLIEAFARPIHMTAKLLDRLAKGDIPEPLTETYKGDFNEIRNNLNMLIDATNDTTQVAEDIANGNLEIEVQERSKDDRLMQALNTMIHSLKDVAGVAEVMADGDLTIEVQERSRQDILMRSLNVMLIKLNGIVLDVKDMTEHVAIGGREMSLTAEALSQGTTQQAASAEEASSAMEQMAANIRQNSENAKITEKIAMESAEDARQGGSAVTKTIEAMKEIEKRISIIQEIAMQTNILSMNATIEAAKAEEYGKGFGVVAAEVRSLARRSREAADGIELLVKSCVEISEGAGVILQRLVPNSEKTAELVQEIAAASREQAMGAEQVNKAIQQLDTVIQQNAATADQMASSAETLSTQADQLHTAMEFFTVRDVRQDIPPEKTAFLEALRSLLHESGAANINILPDLIKIAMAAKQGDENAWHANQMDKETSDTPSETDRSTNETDRSDDPDVPEDNRDECDIEFKPY